MEKEGETAGGHEHMGSCLQIKRKTRELDAGGGAFGRKVDAEHRKRGLEERWLLPGNQ